MITHQVFQPEPFQAGPDLAGECNPGRLRVTVVFTTIAGTLAALGAAARLAKDLAAEIVMVVTDVVSFRYPLESPPVTADYFERVCRTLIEESDLEADVRIEIHFCRDQVDCLRHALRPRSLVLIGARHSRWPRRERKLESSMRALGHNTILILATPQPYDSYAQSVIKRLLEGSAT
jgi:hypothetical protein